MNISHRKKMVIDCERRFAQNPNPKTRSMLQTAIAFYQEAQKILDSYDRA